MKSPSARGTPIDAIRYRKWINRFGSYREGINTVTIETWLSLFDQTDMDVAARILDVVDYYDHSRIHAALKQILAMLPGWHKSRSKRKCNWRFAAMSGSAGESGDAMLYQFRVANGLDSKQYDDLFVSRSELFRQPLLPKGDPNRLGENDVVVLLDDFSGTGNQVCNAWNNAETSFSALLAGVGTVYLGLVAASNAARQRITNETSLRPLIAHHLSDSDSVFSPKCIHFTEAEKTTLLNYGQVADKKHPKGYGDCGFVVVFQSRPPNNSIPILHADHVNWCGLFPRHS